jgi:Pectinacetylesterase
MQQRPWRRGLWRHRAPLARQPLTATLVVVVLAGLLGACSGGDSEDGDAGANSDHDLSEEQEAEFEREVEFAQCLRDEGLEGYPDPQISDSGYIMTGVPFSAGDDWQAAQEACVQVVDDAAPPDDTDETGADAASWEQVAPGGDCLCADGSEFAFWERQADPTKVVLYLDGGGSCVDATTCAFTGLSAGGEANYDWSIWGEDPAEEGGIFDLTRADNPFADHSFIYVPLCTGDVHLGDATREYSPELTVEHNGFVNGTASLDYLAEHYPEATQVVVVGKSGGSMAAPIYGGLAADLLPDTHVTVFGANSGSMSDDPDLNAELGELWGTYANMPDWKENHGLTARDWGPRRFWIQAGLHNPEIVLALFDFAYDRERAEEAAATGQDPSQLLAVIDANEAAIESAGVVQHSYTAPGDGHTILEDDTFYETEVNGVTLVDWVDALITAEPLDDVHCDQCETS